MQKCYILISVFFRGGMTFTYDGSEHFHHFMLLTVVGLNQQTFNMSWTSKRHVVGWKTTNAASQNLIMAACCHHDTGLPTQTLLPPISFIDLSFLIHRQSFCLCLSFLVIALVSPRQNTTTVKYSTSQQKYRRGVIQHWITSPSRLWSLHFWSCVDVRDTQGGREREMERESL